MIKAWFLILQTTCRNFAIFTTWCSWSKGQRSQSFDILALYKSDYYYYYY